MFTELHPFHPPQGLLAWCQEAPLTLFLPPSPGLSRSLPGTLGDSKCLAQEGLCDLGRAAEGQKGGGVRWESPDSSVLDSARPAGWERGGGVLEGRATQRFFWSGALAPLGTLERMNFLTAPSQITKCPNI